MSSETQQIPNELTSLKTEMQKDIERRGSSSSNNRNTAKWEKKSRYVQVAEAIQLAFNLITANYKL